MTVARNQQICIEETPYYHVVSRCVRRAFLCGEKPIRDRHSVGIFLQTHQRFATDNYALKVQNHTFKRSFCMTVARNQQICIEETPYYHIVSRCVRRAFLCGDDKVSGKSFEHRRQWLIDRIKQVTSVFAIDVCSYAIMSNHFHIVLKVNSTKEWNATQVLMTWCSLYSLPA